MRSVYSLAQEKGIHVHLDGARLWNAAQAKGIKESEYAKYADSVMSCFSKGLGAPIGSILAGPEDFIEDARGIRKVLGGGMRQVGYIAAAALYALENHRERLTEDHRRARRIAEEFAGIKALKVDLDTIETNIIFVEVLPPYSAIKWVKFLKENDVLAIPVSKDTVRFVTHLQIDDKDVEKLLLLTHKYFKT